MYAKETYPPNCRLFLSENGRSTKGREGWSKRKRKSKREKERESSFSMPSSFSLSSLSLSPFFESFLSLVQLELPPLLPSAPPCLKISLLLSRQKCTISELNMTNFRLNPSSLTTRMHVYSFIFTCMQLQHLYMYVLLLRGQKAFSLSLIQVTVCVGND